MLIPEGEYGGEAGDAPYEGDPGIGPSHGITHPKKCAMLAAIAQTGNIAAATRATDIARRTHYDWMANDPAYRTAVAAAFQVAIEVLEAVARRRAVNGSDVLLIFLLKSLRPERYREKYEVRHAGTVSVARQVQADLERLFAIPELTKWLEDRFLDGEESAGPPPWELPPPKEV